VKARFDERTAVEAHGGDERRPGEFFAAFF
jgi:hypothetical protein